MTHDETRRALRTRALAARESASDDLRAQWEVAITGYLDTLIGQLAPRILAFCWPWRAEADLREWVACWLAQDAAHVAALPTSTGKDAPLSFRRWTPGAELAPDWHGIPFPSKGEVVLPDVMLIPLNAFDAQGYRLGYGGGYFDRTLATLKTVAVGIGFELGRVADVLPQPHDCPMDWLVTEAGIYRGSTTGRPSANASVKQGLNDFPR